MVCGNLHFKTFYLGEDVNYPNKASKVQFKYTQIQLADEKGDLE